ncbi:hypothetical protein J6590_027357, partial [Homalodisca vitripennis]
PKSLSNFRLSVAGSSDLQPLVDIETSLLSVVDFPPLLPPVPCSGTLSSASSSSRSYPSSPRETPPLTSPNESTGLERRCAGVGAGGLPELCLHRRPLPQEVQGQLCDEDSTVLSSMKKTTPELQQMESFNLENDFLNFQSCPNLVR